MQKAVTMRDRTAPLPRADRLRATSMTEARARLADAVAFVLDHDAARFGCRLRLARNLHQLATLFRTHPLPPALLFVCVESPLVRNRTVLDHVGRMRSAGTLVLAVREKAPSGAPPRLRRRGFDGQVVGPVDRHLFALRLLEQVPQLRT